MDVVRRNIEDLGGTVELRSHAGHGSSVAIVLPLTRASFDGQCVAVGEETFIVPSVNVVESLQSEPAMLSRLAGGGELLALRGTRIPLLRLSETFEVRPREAGFGQRQSLVLIVESAGQRAGLVVDELLERRQVVFKPPQFHATHAAGIAGTAALSASCQARILDVDDLVRMAAEQGRGALQSALNR
jgi:two-component system chemotaxis sensor kinase CheA